MEKVDVAVEDGIITITTGAKTQLNITDLLESCDLKERGKSFQKILGFRKWGSKKYEEVYNFSVADFLRVCKCLWKKAEENAEFSINQIAIELNIYRYKEGGWRIFWDNLEQEGLICKVKPKGRGNSYIVTSQGKKHLKNLLN